MNFFQRLGAQPWMARILNIGVGPQDDEALRFRVGINSGPVIACVIGSKKFIYDLWGDAVNVASRMESHGNAGEIQITRDTYELIKADFDCEPRGTIQVKGKGDMEVWQQKGVRAPPPAAPA